MTKEVLLRLEGENQLALDDAQRDEILSFFDAQSAEF